MMDWKKTLVLWAACAGALLACAPYFPATFIDQEEADCIHAVNESELVYHLSLLAEHFMHDVIPPSPRSREQDPKPPRKEYELYEAGVKEITDNPEECFPKAWKELLQLPPAERRYRTVRTLYMLGNLALRNKEDDASAWKFYQDLRRAVRDEGFPDNLGLSRDTFNALRRYSSALGQLRYLPLAARFQASKVKYQEELEDIVKRLSFSQFKTAMQDPYLAELLLLAAPKMFTEDFPSGKRFLMADRLAMRAYQKGNFLLCAALLEQAPDDSLIKLFLQARFARFKGDNQKAAQFLRKWLKLSAKALDGSPQQYVFYRSNGGGYFDFHATFGAGMQAHRDERRYGWSQEVQGLLGLVTLDERDYEEALLAFMRAGSWPDAALVAEQFMSVEALQKFIVANNIETWWGENGKNISDCLMHLLARALLRQGKVREATRFFPYEYYEIMEDYWRNWKVSNASDSDAETKAKALFRMGQILLRHNIELLGYEFDPDFHICEGAYPTYTPDRLRRPSPLPRFHYRKTIVDTFHKAASLTKDKNLKFASLLAAGWTLRTDAQEADPYYKQLCRLGVKPLSGILDRHRWLPERPSNWRERFFQIELAPDGESLQAYLRELANRWKYLPSEMWRDVKIVVRKEKAKGKDATRPTGEVVEIWQDGKMVYSLRTTHRAYVILFDKGLDWGRRYGHPVPLQNGADFKQYLVDMKGKLNEDKRHLVLVDWNDEDAEPSGKGYLLDAKEHFSFLGELPVGKAFYYPIPSPFDDQ